MDQQRRRMQQGTVLSKPTDAHRARMTEAQIHAVPGARIVYAWGCPRGRVQIVESVITHSGVNRTGMPCIRGTWGDHGAYDLRILPLHQELHGRLGKIGRAHV